MLLLFPVFHTFFFTINKNHQCNLNQNAKLSIHEIILELVACKVSAILSFPQCVHGTVTEPNKPPNQLPKCIYNHRGELTNVFSLVIEICCALNLFLVSRLLIGPDRADVTLCQWCVTMIWLRFRLEQNEISAKFKSQWTICLWVRPRTGVVWLCSGVWLVRIKILSVYQLNQSQLALNFRYCI